MAIASIINGRIKSPRRTLLYGVHGVGKSTWASQAEKPIFIQTEDGIADLDCAKFPLAKTYEDVFSNILDLYEEKHDFKTVVVDSLDWLEKLVFKSLCDEQGKKNIEDFGYGKGYQIALDKWKTFLDGITALRNEKNMSVIFLAHGHIERFENPETESYDRYAPAFHKKASAMIQQWCDEVFFASYKVRIKETTEGMKDRKRGLQGARYIRTSDSPYCMAKNRLNLPEEIGFNYSDYSALLKGFK